MSYMEDEEVIITWTQIAKFLAQLPLTVSYTDLVRRLIVKMLPFSLLYDSSWSY